MRLSGYEMVIGLEVHVELMTRTKIFCGCETAFGAAPNTQVCPVCMGLPGALPVLNRAVIDFAARAGLATNCRVAADSRLDRKNYFYPDLPKAYQISQYDQPLCEGGWLDIQTDAGAKRVRITRIHIEEDAGKLLHDGADTRIDLNRCGVPLIELVTEPDLRSAAEAKAFLQKLRAILTCAGVSDCRMNEGSMRCDVNLSVRKAGEAALGTRTETKNLNSFAFAAKAIEYEFARQVELKRAGGTVEQETRRFDAATGKTHAMRTKENADDYRYFPDPDLPPVHLTAAEIDALRAGLPELPDAKQARFSRDYGLTTAEAGALCAQPPLSEAFDAAAPRCRSPKTLATLMLGELLRLHPGDEPVPVDAERLSALSNQITDGALHLGAAKRVLQAIYDGDETPEAAVERLCLAQISDPSALRTVVESVVQENDRLVQTWLLGKANAFQALMGKVMAATQGRANPVLASELLAEKLSEKKG